MSYTPGLNGGRINFQVSGGNSTSAGAGYSTVTGGTVQLAGGNNITLSQNGNSVTVAGAAGANFGMSNIGNTAGTSGTASNQLILAGGNNVTLSQSTGVGGNTITVSAVAPTIGVSGNVTFGTLNTISSNEARFHFQNFIVSQSSNTISVQAPSLYALSAGMSGGNTSGDGNVMANKNLYLAGGNNVTLSNATAFDGLFGVSQTVTISAANQTVQPGIQSIQVSNTTYTTGNVIFSNANGLSFGSSAGGAITGSYTVPGATVFSNSNNVSFGLNGSTVTATVTTPAQTNQSLGIYASSQTVGQSSSSSYDARSLSMVGRGNVSVGWTNGSLQISAPTQTVQPAVVISGSNNSITSGTASFVNANGVSWSFNGQSISGSVNTSYLGSNASTNYVQANAGFNGTNASGTIASNSISVSVAAQTNQTVGLYGVSNTTQSSSATVDARSLSFAGAGIASVGASNGSVVISVPAGGGGGDGYNSAQFTNSTANSTMPILWAGNSNGSGNITMGLTGSTVTASAPSAGNTTHGTMWFPFNEGVNVAGQAGQGSLGFMPVPTPANREELRVDRLVFPLYFTNASNSTGSLTVSFWMGLYTRTNSSISLAHSLSASASLGWAANNSSANQRGIRLLSFGWTTTIDDARYVVGIVSRSTTAGGNATLSQMLVSQLNSNVSGMWDQASNSSVQWPLGVGYYSATTSGLPNSIAYSQLRGTNSLAARPPSWHMIDGSV